MAEKKKKQTTEETPATPAEIEDAWLEGQTSAEIPRPGDSGCAELTLQRRDASDWRG